MKTLHFIHIGKTGGSAIKHALRAHCELPEWQIELHGHGKRLRDIPEGEFVFFTLRDPVARFVSAFYSRQRKGAPRFNNKWNPYEEQMFERFSTPNELVMAMVQGDELALMAFSRVFHFFRTRFWFGDLHQFKARLESVLMVAFQESLNDDFEALKQLVGLPADLLLPSDNAAAHRGSSNSDKYLDQPAVEFLKNHYAYDYALIDFVNRIAGRQ